MRLYTSLLRTSSNTKVFIKILSSSLNTMLIVDKHCSDVCCNEFPVAQIDRKIDRK